MLVKGAPGDASVNWVIIGLYIRDRPGQVKLISRFYFNSSFIIDPSGADALAPCITRSSATTAPTLSYKIILVFFSIACQLPTLSQCWEMTEKCKYICFLHGNLAHKGVNNFLSWNAPNTVEAAVSNKALLTSGYGSLSPRVSWWSWTWWISFCRIYFLVKKLLYFYLNC